ncbi:FAD-dependent oxidoreductase [Conyzicola nivalis]|uniref:Thioredoxin reductase n=1 Tax=Conyzicola nivalis TaxID=1477021 RepID=A0A916S9M0_9MICO|nr:cyclic nucleotide-binding domain-containing thioredoxin-disulfide reductase [Conyzicola nivalis]GGA90836.1 thioredoxin reductase [Conyzicola nivalis]
MTIPIDAQAQPAAGLTEVLQERLRSYGTPHATVAGEVLYKVGDPGYDLILIEEGTAVVVREATPGSPEEVVSRQNAGGILGEMSLLSRQTVYLTARMEEGGVIHRISPDNLRRLMSTDAELSDMLLTIFMARRQQLQTSAAGSVEIVGHSRSAESLALRTYVARLQLPSRWFEADSPEGAALMRVAEVDATQLPAIIVPEGVIKNATPGLLAQRSGLTYRADSPSEIDLVVVGAGPAGLAATVYGASEGLNTMLLDAVGPGGQAAASSRIENYLGFPNGLSGEDLIARANTQALKFGAHVYSPCKVVGLESVSDGLKILLEDGGAIATKAVIIATGARYKVLDLDRWSDFEGAGIYFAATELEVRPLAGKPVTVVGGANSAGQAAIFLASKGCAVNIVIRGSDISAGMSSYLVDRIEADPLIEVRSSTEVSELRGDAFLSAITLTDRAGGGAEVVPCDGLFCFIGATPATGWLQDVALDDHGFVLTDSRIGDDRLDERWATLDRRPLAFETSVPRVFAVGDVRQGSMKRVAAAVGEGASAVASTHAAIRVMA